jgi:hypothetical protein
VSDGGPRHHSRIEVLRAELANWHIPIRTLIVAAVALAAVASALLSMLEASPTMFVP